MKRYRAFSLTTLIFSVIFFLALASGSQMLSIDSDLGRHITIGNYILDHRIIPTRDLFSHTLTGQSRPPYEWLSQVLFAISHRILGLDGVILFTAAIIAAAFTLTFQTSTHYDRTPLTAFLLTLLAAGASSLHWLPRPHIMTFLLLAIWVAQLEKIQRGKTVRLFVFPVTMLLWANLHGGFIYGILAWLAYFAGWLVEKWRKNSNAQTGKQLLIIGTTSLPASIITPDLWHNWDAVLNNRSAFILSRTVETMPPNLTDPAILPFDLLLAVGVILIIFNRRGIHASHLFLIIGFGSLSLLMTRNIPLFAIACTPIISVLADASISNSKALMKIDERFSNFSKRTTWNLTPLLLLAGTFAYFAVQHLKTNTSVFHYKPQVFPIQAVTWLEENPQDGNMFNEFNWGGYILEETWPRYLVFLDSQSDFYGESLMREYDKAISVQNGWESVFVKYDIFWAIIPSHSLIAQELVTNDWKILYQDDTAIILRKP